MRGNKEVGMRDLVRDEAAAEYVIDLSRSAFGRVAGVALAEEAVARRLFAAAGKELAGVPAAAMDAFGTWYRKSGGLYVGEMRVWAAATDRSFGEVAVINCGYELSHLEHHWIVELLGRVGKVFGCTAGVCEVAGGTPVHVRNLDWPVVAMGEGTRVFRYRTTAGHEFWSVGFPGFVGVLSGMVPGGYSATINWAPPVGRPRWEVGATFLLRDVLETCATYSAAVERLKSEKLSSSVFFTVCGANKGEGCVIERTGEEAVVRPMTGGMVVQANHHDDTCAFSENNRELKKFEADELIKTTRRRRGLIEEALRELVGKEASGDELIGALGRGAVCNAQTVQRMVFWPGRGEMWVERLVSSDEGERVWGRSVWKSGMTKSE